MGQACPLLMLIRVKLAGDLVKTTLRGLVSKKGEGSRLQGQHTGLEWRKVFSPHLVAFLKSRFLGLSSVRTGRQAFGNNGREVHVFPGVSVRM